MDLNLKGKVAIITGGSDGIGKAAALSLSREGARVAIAARTEATLANAAKEIIELRFVVVRAVHAACDLDGREPVLVDDTLQFADRARDVL